jgi:DNA-binding CsgD family transcriptional regulator
MADLSTSAFGDLVGRIYDCAVDAAKWPSAVDALRRALGYEIGVLALHDLPHGRVLLDDTVNIAEPWQGRRAAFHADAVALWGGVGFIQRHPVDEPAALSRVTPLALSETSNPWAVHWAAPQGLVDHLALVLARDGGAIGCLGFGRHRDVGAISDGDVAAARLFIPHLQRASAIGRLLDMRRTAATDLGTVLDGLSQPVVLVDERATICFRNAAAGPLFEAGGPLQDVDGRVSSPVGSVANALRRAIHECAGSGVPVGRGFGIPVRAHGGGVYALHVLPLGATGVRRPPTRKAVAALFVSSASARMACSADLIAALYGLTRAETRVFELLADGQTTQAAAATLGISSSTFKTHLLRVFAKVGVHRQGDLVRLAAAVAPPVRSASSAAAADGAGCGGQV